MANFKNDMAEYVADIFKKRLRELGLSQTRFVSEYAEFTNRPTLYRILRGHGSTSISTVAHYANLLGLEIKIVKKENK